MKVALRMIISAAIPFWLLFFTFAFAKPYQAVREGANIRLDSTTFSESIGNLSKGEIVEVDQQRHDWYRIILPEKVSCWVAADYIKKTDDGLGEITATRLNIRSQNSLEGIIIGSVQRGDRVAVKKERGDWVEISCYPYAKGWVHKNLLKELDQEQSLAYLVNASLTQLPLASEKERKNIQESLVRKGRAVVPIIEERIQNLNQPAILTVIEVFSRLGKKNPELIDYYFNQITFDFLPKSTAYLDVLENIILEDSPKIPFYYLAQKGRLSRPAMQKSYDYLKEKYEKQKTPESETIKQQSYPATSN